MFLMPDVTSISGANLLNHSKNKSFISLKHQEGRQYYLSTKNLFGVQSVTKKSSVISQNHQQGGLKIIEMNKYIISLKCSLLKGLFNGKKKSSIFIFESINGVKIVQKLFDFGDAIIFECVIPENDVFDKIFSIHFSVL